ncbi:hypothetical protein GGS21DRAFT_510732 [Xylaria nigripes]|nr:hypothetical protein GGS21DRAFT_510732 [Xylaria nigripes]
MMLYRFPGFFSFPSLPCSIFTYTSSASLHLRLLLILIPARHWHLSQVASSSRAKVCIHVPTAVMYSIMQKTAKHTL